MATAIVSSIMSMAGKLAAATVRRSSSAPTSSTDPFSSVKEDLDHTKRTLLRIQAVLADAAKREVTEESVKLWLRELRTVAYDAEDVLGEYNYELMRGQIEGSAGPSDSGATRKSKRADLPFLDGIAARINEIRKRFDEIAADREGREALSLREEDGERRTTAATAKPPPTSSLVDDATVYGREEDKQKLLNFLLSDDKQASRFQFSVLPIIGMGGVTVSVP